MAIEMMPLAVVPKPAAKRPLPTALVLLPIAELWMAVALLRKPTAMAKSLVAPDEIPMAMLPCPQFVNGGEPVQG